MHLVTLGINHKTAPVALREQAAFDPQTLPDALRAVTEAGAGEATILSTCNRTELYCGLDSASDESLIDWFCHYHKITPRTVRPYLYIHDGRTAVAHAFRVACGLDSLILGEPQILGQMKTAFAAAHKAGTTGKLLNRLFHHTFAVAKQVRTDTAIGANAVSVAYAAVSLARRVVPRIPARRRGGFCPDPGAPRLSGVYGILGICLVGVGRHRGDRHRMDRRGLPSNTGRPGSRRYNIRGRRRGPDLGISVSVQRPCTS